MIIDNVSSSNQVIPVSALNQYLYCPRRYWYYRFFDPRDVSAALVDGQRQHDRQSQHPDWIRERYLRSEQLGLHGCVDVLDESETDTTTPIPVERKRATSGRVYRNDEIQVTAYGLLLEATSGAVETVDYGIVYLYETDERHRIELTQDRREAVHSIREKILQLESDDPPSLVENRNKCRGCSVRHYCQPETETYLDSKPGYVDQVVNRGENDAC